MSADSVISTARLVPPARVLLDAVTADNAIPTSATAGLDISDIQFPLAMAHFGLNMVRTGGSNPSVVASVYGYGDYDGTGVKKWWWIGDLNGGTAISATSCPKAVNATGTINYLEKVALDGIAERLFLLLASLTATTTVEAGVSVVGG